MLGRSVGQLVGWLVGRSVGRSVGWLVDRSVSCLLPCLLASLLDRLVAWLLGCLVAWVGSPHLPVVFKALVASRSSALCLTRRSWPS